MEAVDQDRAGPSRPAMLLFAFVKKKKLVLTKDRVGLVSSMVMTLSRKMFFFSEVDRPKPVQRFEGGLWLGCARFGVQEQTTQSEKQPLKKTQDPPARTADAATRGAAQGSGQF